MLLQLLDEQQGACAARQAGPRTPCTAEGTGTPANKATTGTD